ncbi:hypothetical protein GMDG_09049, partial [Pseudogymnoascus destructans 20631-21]
MTRKRPRGRCAGTVSGGLLQPIGAGDAIAPGVFRRIEGGVGALQQRRGAFARTALGEARGHGHGAQFVIGRAPSQRAGADFPPDRFERPVNLDGRLAGEDEGELLAA